tara:strand:- start:33 stop:707 length:675 start_codon:yes stop_codon:yes gene_type:complete
MIEDNQESTWYTYHLPNTPLLKCELEQKYVDYLWKQIDKASSLQRNANGNLAGNISKSLYLDDEDDYFFSNVLQKPCQQYLEENPKIITNKNTFAPFSTSVLKLTNFWVNSQRETEFNPTHNHGGVLSFVIWMKIPTDWREQHEIPFSKESNTPMASDFQFLYTDIMGSIQGSNIAMDSETEGTMMVFPSTIIHQVYPFYNCDDDRISISGNIYFDPKQLKDML